MPTENNSFKLPSSEDFDRIAHNHALDRDQANELEVRVRHALYDLEVFYHGRLDREARAKEIAEKRAFLEALNRVLAVVGKDPAAFNNYLPFDIREEMVAGVEWSAIENVTGKSAATWASDEETARNTVGLLHGTEIFSDYIARVRALLIDFFDEEDEHPDRGGREPDYVRDHMLRALIRWYANVLGKKPTPTSKGPFQNLVADVFHACAIKDDGLERAVERMLEKWREAETKRQRVKSP